MTFFLSLLLCFAHPAAADEARDREKLLRQFDREISRFQKRIQNVIHEHYDSPSAVDWEAELDLRREARDASLKRGKRIRGKDKEGVPETVIEDYFRDAGTDADQYTITRGGTLADLNVAPDLTQREELKKFLDPEVIAGLRKEFEAKIDAEGATKMRSRIRSQYTGVNGCIWQKWSAWTGFVVLFAAEVGLGIAMVDPTLVAETGLSWIANIATGGSIGAYAGIFGGVITLVSAEFALTKKIAPPVRCRFQRRLNR